MNSQFVSISSLELARVAGGAARVASTGNDISTQMQMELQQLTSSLSNLQNNNNNSSSSMMLPMMMMMMGQGGSSQAQAAPPPPAPPPNVVRVNVR